MCPSLLDPVVNVRNEVTVTVDAPSTNSGDEPQVTPNDVIVGLLEKSLLSCLSCFSRVLFRGRCVGESNHNSRAFEANDITISQSGITALMVQSTATSLRRCLVYSRSNPQAVNRYIMKHNEAVTETEHPRRLVGT